MILISQVGRVCIAAGAAAILAAACATPPSAVGPAAKALPPQTAPEMPEPLAATDLALRVEPGSDFTLDVAESREALVAFKKSCPSLTKRTDGSGLTTPSDWTPVCAAVSTATDAQAFFQAYFDRVTVGEGNGLNTGYFEPELRGSRTPSADFPVPLYRRPPELVDVDLGQFRDGLRGQRIAGEVKSGRLTPFADRAAIDDGALKGRNLELLWVADPYEAFFLHIQGSGRIRLQDDTIVRVGYDGQNGHAYTGMGRRLLDLGLVAPGQSTMQGIIAWSRANPAKAREIMRENKSFVFFRTLATDAPVGALGVPLTSERSIAVDPRFITLGAPVWLESRHPDPADVQRFRPFSRLMVAQDTGGAIKGPNRVDVFWGAGARAALIAGAMSTQGRLQVMIPKSASARLRQTLLAGQP